MSNYAAAVASKEKGNLCFQSGDYNTAEHHYTSAIIQDPTNPVLFTNRALARLRLSKHEDVIADAEHAIQLLPSSLKAYTYLGQAQLRLCRPEAAFRASRKAYDLALDQRSPSAASIAATCLEAKKAAWEAQQRRQLADQNALLRETSDTIRHAAVTLDEREDAEDRIRQLEDVFARAAAKMGERREVPDWAVDSITFGVMFDPVVTRLGHSYDRGTLLDHLKRSRTDPLTREPLTEEDLRPNLALREACEEFVRENGWAVDW